MFIICYCRLLQNNLRLVAITATTIASNCDETIVTAVKTATVSVRVFCFYNG